MKKINEKDVPFKYEKSGPKYIFNEPKFAGGIAYLNPNDEIKEHFHIDESEVFYFIKGTPSFLINGEKIKVEEGDGILVMPQEKHGVINDTDKTVQLFFLKIKRE